MNRLRNLTPFKVLRIAASLTLDDITYTAVTPGAAGNSIQIEYVDPGTPNAPTSATWDSFTLILSVSLGTDPSGTLNATADDVQSVVNGTSPLLTSSVTGSGINFQSVYPPTNLTGGVG
jgi:hypothetical protein